MSELKYISNKDGEEKISLDQVTTSDEEIAQVEARMNTQQEDQRVKDASAERDEDQKALWKKQAQKAWAQSGEVKNQDNFYANQLKENGIDDLCELEVVIKKIGKILLEQPVEWRREYAQESTQFLQLKDYFEGYKDLSDKEMDVFRMLKADKDVHSNIQKTFSFEREQDDFIKKSIRAEHKTEYKMCLTSSRE